VRVYNSTFCNNNETQAFCTFFPNGGAPECGASVGSPIFCGVSFVELNGFLITDTRPIGGICKQIGDRSANQYHSVEDFRDWIMQVSAGGKLHVPLVMILGFLGYFLNFSFL
jgi:hypothetical protein